MGIGVVIKEIDEGIGMSKIEFMEIIVNEIRWKIIEILISNVMDDLEEIEMKVERKVKEVIGLKDIGDKEIERLRIDEDDRIVGEEKIMRIDRKVRKLKKRRIGRKERFNEIVDRIMMREGERSIEKIEKIRMEIGDIKMVGILVELINKVDIGEIKKGVDEMSVNVERKSKKIKIESEIEIEEKSELKEIRE